MTSLEGVVYDLVDQGYKTRMFDFTRAAGKGSKAHVEGLILRMLSS